MFSIFKKTFNKVFSIFFTHSYKFNFFLVNLLHTYPLLYKIIAILGIFYMLYVGYCEIKSGIYPNKEEIKFIGVSKKNTEYFIKGFFTNMLNPKVGIFYLTFLPQFIQSGQINIKSIIFLGSIHIIIGIIWLTFCSSSIDYCKKFINNKKVINYLSIITGIIIISFAVFIGWQAFYSI